MYSISGVNKLIKQDNPDKGRQSYIYARVSSSKQKGDLERQINDLKEAYPDHIVIKDIASGVNFKRKGLETLLEHVIGGMVAQVVVAHRDRLARLGCDMLEFIFSKTGTKLVVLGNDEEDEHDLASDLLAVTTLFVASYNGRRSAANRKRRKEEAASKTEKRRKEEVEDDESEGEEEL